MTRPDTSRLGVAVSFCAMIALSACAGGNAIDRGVPRAAIAETNAPFPPPVRPDAEGLDATTVPDSQTPPVLDEPDVADVAGPGQTAFPEPPSQAAFSETGQASVTGTFPNINDIPQGATAQFGDVESDALLQQMQALASARESGRISQAEYGRRVAQLRKLAATHSDEAIKRIEGQ